MIAEFKCPWCGSLMNLNVKKFAESAMREERYQQKCECGKLALLSGQVRINNIELLNLFIERLSSADEESEDHESKAVSKVDIDLN